MTSSCWINGYDQCLAAVIHKPNINKYRLAALLMSGFASPMCDIDYFMSKTARKLCGLGIYAVQVDPIGHGDSYGLLSDISLKTYREGIKNVIQYIQGEIGNEIVCIGRGLSATLQYELACEMNLQKVVGINPYNIHGNMLKQIWKAEFDGVAEISDIYIGKDYKTYSDFDQKKRCFFNALGGSILNLHGQCISGSFINELSGFYPSFHKDACNATWIMCEEELLITNACDGIETLDQLSGWKKKEGLPRSPIYQDKIINQILSCVIEGR